MHYLLAVYGDSTRWGSLNEADARAESEALEAFDREASEAGTLVTRAPLQLEAWSISAEDGEVKDRALSDPARRLGCFYVIECDNAADAKAWAAKFPLIGPGGFDSIEIRPITSN